VRSRICALVGRRVYLQRMYFCSYLQVIFFTCRKILRHAVSGFTSPPKEGVLRIFIALKSPSPRRGLNLRMLGPTASTLTTTPPRRLSLGFTRVESQPPLSVLRLRSCAQTSGHFLEIDHDCLLPNPYLLTIQTLTWHTELVLLPYRVYTVTYSVFWHPVVDSIITFNLIRQHH
jgi:hypothetical protein